jgi:hypothetical protein
MFGSDRRRRAVVCAMLLSGALPLFAGSSAGSPKEDSDGRPPGALHLPFRGYGLTIDHRLVRIFGDDQRYTVWPFADLSGLPWADFSLYNGSLASDPWEPWSLFVSVGSDDEGAGDFSGVTALYRFDLPTLTATLETYYASLGPSWSSLEGLGSRCASHLPGQVAFYSDRTKGSGNIYGVREISNTGNEIGVADSTSLSRFGDNTAEWFGGPHWFTAIRVPGLTKGLSNLSNVFVPVPGLLDNPTGLLAYGAGAFYMSAEDGKMRLVTTAGTSTVLQYIQWGTPALPAPPLMIDLTNPPAHCKKIEP